MLASRILTAYYFAHFLIVLPLLAVETPRRLPGSIAEAVLGKGGSASAMAAGAAQSPNTKG